MSTTHGSPPVPSSPIFDAPEFPTLRKTRALPRRARGVDPPSRLDGGDGGVVAEEDPMDDPGYGVLPSADVPTGNARVISGRPGKVSTQPTTTTTTATYEHPLDELEGDLEGEGDGGYYSDRMQHGNNAKKRKVPAAGAGALGVGGSYRHQDPSEDGDSAPVFNPSAASSSSSHEAQHNGNTPNPRPLAKGKLSPATYAGIAHKEMLKTRKRQLAAVLGALSHGDTLALDQALSATYPVAGLIPMSFASSVAGDEVRMRMSFSASTSAPGSAPGNGNEGPKTRLSKRATPRGARVFKKGLLPRHPDSAPFPQCDFEFRSPSATSKRLVATKEEVAALRKRFEAELTRQAAKAAKLAASHRLATARGSRGTKRPERAKQRARAPPNTARGAEDGQAEFLQPSQASHQTSAPQAARHQQQQQQHAPTPPLYNAPPIPSKPHGKKKKKRSALANASNPHHLRNYVPSRLPHSSPAPAQATGPFDMSPFPIRFLSADIPSKRGKRGARNLAVPTDAQGQAGGALSLTNPADEWICAMCEYELFYGDDAAFRRAVRNRKKILSRRRRALERARGGAQRKGGGGGNVAPVRRGDDGSELDEDDEEYDGAGCDADGDGVAEFAEMPEDIRRGLEGGFG